jgi:nitroreductase
MKIFNKQVKKVWEEIMIKDLLLSNRSYRRFDNSLKIDSETMETLIDSARLTCSARNAQPLRFIYSINDDVNKQIFSTLSWAGALKNWDGPEEFERPSGYIIVTTKQANIKWTMFDCGAMSQSILMTARENGLGGCILGAVSREKLSEIISLEPENEIMVVIAIGKPIEKVVIEEMQNDECNYWRDAEKTHHVPKRNLTDLITKRYI